MFIQHALVSHNMFSFSSTSPNVPWKLHFMSPIWIIMKRFHSCASFCKILWTSLQLVQDNSSVPCRSSPRGAGTLDIMIDGAAHDFLSRRTCCCCNEEAVQYSRDQNNMLISRAIHRSGFNSFLLTPLYSVLRCSHRFHLDRNDISWSVLAFRLSCFLL